MKDYEENFPPQITSTDGDETLCVDPPPGQPCPQTQETAGGDPTVLYGLNGPQVEFEAAYWLINPQLRVPTVEEVLKKIGTLTPYPNDALTLRQEISELKSFASKRDNALPGGYLSEFINLQPPPFGAIINGSSTRQQFRLDCVKRQLTRLRLKKTLVLSGRELARMFENETPGLLHRHALNFLLYMRSDFSPVRHARIWSALDITIYAALSAAWHLKWALDKSTISFRQRPWEYDPTLDVLFDREGNERGDGDGIFRTCPCPTPGTPRHPAYPSGHSTYSAAASRILSYFFEDDDSAVEELKKLADNIGEARLWAGVHWCSDHVFGQRVGIAVAELIIDQLKKDCVPVVSTKTCMDRKDEMPPSENELEGARQRREQPCEQPDEHDRIPIRTKAPKENRVF